MAMTTTPALQRLTSSPRSVSATIHATGLLCFAASFVWLPNITNPLHRGFGGSYQFLTIIALTLSTMTFATGFVADLSQNTRLAALKSRLSVCATPLELLVTISYWGLRCIDKTLVVPPGHEVPFIPDFGFHAMPGIMIILDLMLLSPPWSIKADGALALNSFMALSYLAWLEYCFSQNRWYPYPLLARLSMRQKLCLVPVSAVLMTGSTMALKRVYRRVNKVQRFGRDAIIAVKTD
ncbi:hypothetical protein A1O3_02535 [Capronia epimyces CBS 606.96]|uniref:Uncharacterized protein n=1 Tax=Capronia epimyces CBS 606.96 TaxID=1182542 RepID=W9YAD9_9EURO|nr:uncharacterized protein A1O3_02535 [Capronia epimyces CBS 606.96]EXJ89468.1 hypothetical protein A1O3_02535 [Capronia epimyces CBS 606.96]